MNQVAFIIPGIERIGGAEKQVLLLASGFARRGWRVHLICMSGSVSVAARALPGVECIGLGMRHGWKDPRGWLRLIRWLRMTRPGILHAHLPHATWMARWSRCFAPMRVVCETLHTSATNGLRLRMGYRWSNWLSNCVSAVGESVARHWRASGAVEARKLIVIPNAVPISEAAGARSAQVGAHKQFMWLAVGRVEMVKDYATMLRAFARLDDSAHLTIAGDGSERVKMQSLATHLGLGSRVHWAGFVEDLSKLYLVADAFALSSLWEGLPMSILEASSFRLPIVATDAPGVCDALPASSHAWLANVGDADGLWHKMKLMMELSDEERGRIGEENFYFVNEHNALEKILDAWEKTYLQLLAENPLPRRSA